jgi:Response regulator containing a CheY-like receiver domain and an HTH DNA-binding domain
MIKIGIIEENVILSNNYEQILTSFNDMRVVFRHKNIISLGENLNRVFDVPDIIMLDIKLPFITGIRGIEKLNAFFPKASIMIISSFVSYDNINEALKKGAKGFVIKSTSYLELHHAIRSVIDYGAYLSPRITAELLENYNKISYTNLPVKYTKKENSVLQCIIKGLSYKEVANELNISTYSVNQYLKKIYKKENVNSKGELIYKLLKQKV